MAIVGREFAVEFCKALGIDPRLVRKVTLELPHDDVVTVTVERLVEREQMEGALRLLTERHEIK